MVRRGAGAWYRGFSLGIPLSPAGSRWLHGSMAALLLAGLLTCRFLEPSPDGQGTHAQLGLPPCLICSVTGWERCPSCGMTTALAHLTRGEWQEAREVHRASPFVFGLVIFAVIYCAAMAWAGKNWVAQELAVCSILSLCGFAAWLVALF
ncbi:MAG: DUF2752 domain-containing protein [Candidatus Hydrogenedentota bacterium]